MADDTVVTPAPTSAEAAPVAAPTADTIRSEIDSMAVEYGYSPTTFAGFKDVDSARAALKVAIETAASQRYGGQNMTAPTANLPADRFSKPAAQSEPTSQSLASYKPIDYKALGLDEDDAASKALKQQEQYLQQLATRQAAMESRYEEQSQLSAAREEQMILAQAEEVISGFASPKYGTMQHRTNIQQSNFNHLLENAAIIRENSGHTLPLKACLNQARALDEGTIAAMQTVLPAKKTADSVLSQGGAPALSQGVAKMKMTDVWSDNPEFREKLGLAPRGQLQ